MGKIEKSSAVTLAIAVFALVLSAVGLRAQSQPAVSQPEHAQDKGVVRTFYLANATEANDLNEVQTALRIMVPKAQIFAVSSQYAIAVRAAPEELDAAQKLIAELDHPRRVYRLIYTITNFDADKRTGSQRFVLLAATGQRTVFKHGSRVPIVTALKSGHSDSSDQNAQVQYVDVGLNIEATVTGAPDAPSLRSRIDQTSTSDDAPVSSNIPRIKQTGFDESFQLTQGKPVVIGSLDLPGTTRRQEIEVVAELVR
jgi:hypothetical protein